MALCSCSLRGQLWRVEIHSSLKKISSELSGSGKIDEKAGVQQLGAGDYVVGGAVVVESQLITLVRKHAA